jgi:hypothetical protein
MFKTFLAKIKKRRMTAKLTERLADERRYNAKGGYGRVPLIRQLVDGTDFSIIDPAKERK